MCLRMRLARSTSLALLTVITALTMAGCSDKRADPGASAADINTNHYFTDGQSLRIFNPETRQSFQVDTFDAGENQLVYFDTDVNKQGYEYVVYAKEGDIHVKSLEKNSGAPRIIAKFNRTICGLFPRQSAVQNNTSSATIDSLLVQDLYIVDVESNASPDCDTETSSSTYREFDFSFLKSGSAFDSKLQSQETSSAFVKGVMLRNYRPLIGKDPDTKEDIRWGYIGYDESAETIQFYNQYAKLIWQTRVGSTTPKFVQASDDLLVVQIDQEIYVRNIPELFALGQGSDPELPSDTNIADYFEDSDLTTTSADISQPGNVRGDGKNFAVKDGRKLHYYDADRRFLDPIEASIDVEDFDFSIFPASPPLLLINMSLADGRKNLNMRTTDSLVDETLAEGEDVQYDIVDNILYVNTFRERIKDEDENVIDEAPSWRAHRIVTPINLETSKRTYDLGMFVFAEDLRNQHMEILMLKADSSIDGELVSPRIGPYSPTQQTGIYDGNVFGTVNGNVQTSNLAEYQNFVMNNIYGGFFTQTGDTTNLYYFNLNDPKDSLSLMY